MGLELSLVALGLAFLAGLVTTLSPCVLPLLPMIASAAAGRHRLGLVALAAGLATAFTVVGVSLAAGGQWLGLDERVLRQAAGALMLLVGLTLMVPALQRRMTVALAGIGNAGHAGAARIHSDHPGAQFGIGLLMGVAWSPCVGPTLGAAIGLAASGGGTAEATVIMATFSLAAVIPLTFAGLASRAAFARRQTDLQRLGQIGQRVMAWSLVIVGILVLSGVDKQLEAMLLDFAPDWLLNLTTRF
jgi:cytochrome c-type biogenesis protein